MQISEDTPLTHLLITAYQDNTLWVNHIAYSHSIILTPDGVTQWENVNDLAQLLQYHPEIVLIGSDTSHFHPKDFILFYEKKIGVEAMRLQSAARTYNVLANEGRKVVAGFII